MPKPDVPPQVVPPDIWKLTDKYVENQVRLELEKHRQEQWTNRKWWLVGVLLGSAGLIYSIVTTVLDAAVKAALAPKEMELEKRISAYELKTQEGIGRFLQNLHGSIEDARRLKEPLAALQRELEARTKTMEHADAQLLFIKSQFEEMRDDVWAKSELYLEQLGKEIGQVVLVEEV